MLLNSNAYKSITKTALMVVNFYLLYLFQLSWLTHLSHRRRQVALVLRVEGEVTAADNAG